MPAVMAPALAFRACVPSHNPLDMLVPVSNHALPDWSMMAVIHSSLSCRH